jgi:hypothetical protein
LDSCSTAFKAGSYATVAVMVVAAALSAPATGGGSLALVGAGLALKAAVKATVKGLAKAGRVVAEAVARAAKAGMPKVGQALRAGAARVGQAVSVVRSRVSAAVRNLKPAGGDPGMATFPPFGIGGGGGRAAPDIMNANYAQRTFKERFSTDGLFKGALIDDVAGALRSGAMSPKDVPISAIVREGNTLILNTRSSQALIRAGIPRRLWHMVDETGLVDPEDRLTDQLRRNGLTGAGIGFVRSTGGRG